MQHIIIENINRIDEAASKFISLMSDHTVFAFEGKMGVGKTTFIKAICEKLCVDDVINSPTFSIINEYSSSATQQLIYHFDFYRINTIREAQEIGIEDYLYSGAYCFIEWPEKIISLLPEDTLFVEIVEQPDNSRIVLINYKKLK